MVTLKRIKVFLLLAGEIFLHGACRSAWQVSHEKKRLMLKQKLLCISRESSDSLLDVLSPLSIASCVFLGPV